MAHMATPGELRLGGRTSTPVEWVIARVHPSIVVVRRCGRGHEELQGRGVQDCVVMTSLCQLLERDAGLGNDGQYLPTPSRLMRDHAM